MASSTIVAAVPATTFSLADAEVALWPAALAEDEATTLFDALRDCIAWQHEQVLIFGRWCQVPRLVAWYGDEGARYTYSGTQHEPLPWIPALEMIQQRITELTGRRFNSVLLNLYRHGRDGMGWHSDDEPELGPNPVIASVSLGAVRRFCLRHRSQKGQKLDIPLPHGSLLLMSGTTQHHWLHAVPKTARPVGQRINLTFRQVEFR